MLRLSSASNKRSPAKFRLPGLFFLFAVVCGLAGLLKEVVPLVVAHHEYFDGGGYHHMKYDEIPLGSRILAVVDAYDSIISDRPYRTGRTPWEAMREIEMHSGTQFDPQVVKAFFAVVKKEVQYV